MFQRIKGPQFIQSKSALQIRGSLSTNSLRNSSMSIFPQLKSPTKPLSLKPIDESKYGLNNIEYTDLGIKIIPPTVDNPNLGIDDLNKLYELINFEADYKVYVHVPDNNGVLIEKLYLINKMYDQINKNPIFLSQAEITTNVFNLIDQNIRYKLINISEFWFISDYPAYFTLTGLDYLKVWYSMLQVFIQKYPYVITSSYWKHLVSRFKSPVKEEQALAKDTLLLYFSKFSDQRDSIIDEVNHLIKNYRDRVVQHFVALPCIQFLSAILNNTPQIPSIFFAQSRVIVFPLFITPRLEEFFDPLSKYSEIFTKKDSTTTLFFIRFLLKHWPITDSHKQIIFLNELHIILFSLGSSFFPTICVPVCSKLFLSVKSSNAKVCNTAFKILGDEGFIGMLIKTVGFIPAQLEESIKIALNSWSEDVKRTAQEAAANVAKFKSKTELVQPNDFMNKWKKVARFAVKNFHGDFIDFDSELQQYSFDFTL